MSMPSPFRARAAAAAADKALHAKLDHASLPFLEKRAHVFAALPDGEARRDRARAAKAYAVAHLDTLLPELERRLVEHGCVVHWASDAAEACRLVLDIAARNGVRLVVKGKSMVSEEIALNASLAAAGIEAVETDLGEYIVQLAGVPPSHIITPAIHMSQDDVAALFTSRLGEPRHETAEALTAVARRVLREKFRQAGMGVTGVNVASAESGTLVVVENEGNGRMALTLPRVHVALMGIEKLVARDADLAPLLEILPRSATGQTLTSYVSLVSGPRRPGETDGPDEVHVVLLDNGRSRVLADPAVREALYCLRCGACLNACPVYRKVGGHAYGYPYSGPIGAILAPGLLGIAQVPDLPFASTLCGACRDVCPVRIDIPRLLLTWRARATALRSASASERLLVRGWRRLASSAALYRLLAPAARAGAALLARVPALARLAPPLAAWERTRRLPAPAAASFHERWRARRDGDGSRAA
ncbi:MAG TPA: lactate utilization protein B [Candidatus Binatia bacterium]|jgi:L-lactate dehydrogenase complex protein LldF